MLTVTVSHGHLDQTQVPGFLIALAISWWLTPEIRSRAMKLGLVDKPGEERRIHKVAVPRLGGVAIYISIMVSLVMMMTLCGRFPREGGLLGIASGGTLIFVMGLLDDLESIPAKVKLGVQVLAACAAYSLGVRINHVLLLQPDVVNFLQPIIGSVVSFHVGVNGTADGVVLGALAFPLTVLWLVGISNAVNLIDGMDGLAAGVSLISAITIWSVAMSPHVSLHQPYAAWIAAVLAGALLGFLRWNFNPARIFLGDSGAYLAGFILAAVAVTGVMKTATALTLLLPALILFFPILDTSWAIIRRLARGKSIFAPDAEHIHHRLLRTGLSQKHVAYLIYGFSGLLGLLACWMVGQQGYYLTVCAGVLTMALFFAEVLNRNRQRPTKGNKGDPVPTPPPPAPDDPYEPIARRVLGADTLPRPESPARPI